MRNLISKIKSKHAAILLSAVSVGILMVSTTYNQSYAESVDSYSVAVFSNNVITSRSMNGRMIQNDNFTLLMDTSDELIKSNLITVDGKGIAINNDRRALEKLLKEIASPYINENTIEVSFVEDVKIEYDYAPKSLAYDIESIKEKMTSNTVEGIYYTAIKGDTYYDIANTYSMSLEELMTINPQADFNKLMIGDVINVKQAVPFVSVQTVEDVTYDETVGSPVEYVDDSSLYVGDEVVISQGQDGTANVHAKVTRVNGGEVNKEVIESKTLVEPTTTVVARGTTPRPKTASYGTYIWPVSGRISSGYGSRYIFGAYSFHPAIDIAAPYGTNVMASDGGVVTFAGWQDSYGQLVIITHDNGVQTYYAHNSSLLVSRGERVYQGQAIAKVGSTGTSTGNHCHFEIKINGISRNPYNYLQ